MPAKLLPPASNIQHRTRNQSLLKQALQKLLKQTLQRHLQPQPTLTKLQQTLHLRDPSMALALHLVSLAGRLSGANRPRGAAEPEPEVDMACGDMWMNM